MPKIETNDINRAAFYAGMGAKFVSVSGKPPRSTFTLNVPKWVFWYEKYIGIISYKRYSNQRWRLKRIARRAAGLPVNYSAKRRNTLNDILGFDLRKMYKNTLSKK